MARICRFHCDFVFLLGFRKQTTLLPDANNNMCISGVNMKDSLEPMPVTTMLIRLCKLGCTTTNLVYMHIGIVPLRLIASQVLNSLPEHYRFLNFPSVPGRSIRTIGSTCSIKTHPQALDRDWAPTPADFCSKSLAVCPLHQVRIK